MLRRTATVLHAATACWLVLLGSNTAKGQQKPPLLTVPFDAAAAAKGRAAWAADTGIPGELTNSVGMKLILIPPGRFTLGPNGSTYRVTLTKPFLIGTTEVTLGQYRKSAAGHRVDGAEDAFNADDRPAAGVSWHEARAFCHWLSDQPAERSAGRRYALPTEAQWEWAARAGSNKDVPSDAGPGKRNDKLLQEHAWFNHTYTPNPKHESAGRGRQPVAKRTANAWGLYDTLGNVWEWCADRRIDDATGEERLPVMRGGSWRSGGFHCTVVAHDPGEPGMKGDHIGFRVVCTLHDAK